MRLVVVMQGWKMRWRRGKGVLGATGGGEGRLVEEGRGGVCASG